MAGIPLRFIPISDPAGALVHFNRVVKSARTAVRDELGEDAKVGRIDGDGFEVKAYADVDARGRIAEAVQRSLRSAMSDLGFELVPSGQIIPEGQEISAEDLG